MLSCLDKGSKTPVHHTYSKESVRTLYFLKTKRRPILDDVERLRDREIDQTTL